jgi:hypothetical protein
MAYSHDQAYIAQAPYIARHSKSNCQFFLPPRQTSPALLFPGATLAHKNIFDE